ncbi:MAG: hypothetical protein KGR26_03425 [Cyanobacteria bacterium REEB65]|nr:hypothetical protein [Cyanobacteria bacterium REEB65]
MPLPSTVAPANAAKYPRWLFGVLYYHPGDDRLILPIRGGRDHIFNYAKPLALVLTSASILLPGFGAVMLIGGFLRNYDEIMTHLALVAIPTAIVLVCVASVSANAFISEEPHRVWRARQPQTPSSPIDRGA